VNEKTVHVPTALKKCNTYLAIRNKCQHSKIQHGFRHGKEKSSSLT